MTFLVGLRWWQDCLCTELVGFGQVVGSVCWESMLGHNSAVSHQNMATLCFDIVPTMWPNVCHICSIAWSLSLRLRSDSDLRDRGYVHGHCRRFLLSPCSVWLPFQPPYHFAATRLRMVGGELGACPGQVGHRVSVLGKDHPCRRVFFRYCSRAWQSLSSSRCRPFQDERIVLFMDFTVVLILPLLWGYRVVDVMCVKHHCAANSRNFFDVNCGPSSNQNTCTAEWLSDHLDEVGGCGVMARQDDVGPVSIAIYQD